MIIFESVFRYIIYENKEEMDSHIKLMLSIGWELESSNMLTANFIKNEKVDVKNEDTE